jgi:hypothetical protein
MLFKNLEPGDIFLISGIAEGQEYAPALKKLRRPSDPGNITAVWMTDGDVVNIRENEKVIKIGM